ncbi:hypothetical protein FA15DRAFT_671200 [Coprinopsis marcescibilis]|uniref:DUF829-domain-containing protein n=1 Tax=Coprinopsis marcescibilis TaxID=230819 RepID=A0A5C3KQU3_COPMA|nr:hypothetical protein FA15DRAFT_671200 [Coprinopsis marcescibilis]
MSSTRKNGSVVDSENPLVSIGKGIHILKPADTTKRDIPEESQPNVILIFGWMMARLPHILKYVKTYNEIYPAATIVVIQSDSRAFWQSKNTRKANLAPAVEALEALGCLPPPARKTIANGSSIEPLYVKPAPRILVHAFSNGGCFELTTLSNILAERYPQSSYPTTNLPPTALVLDSCPGNGGLAESKLAFTEAIRNPIIAWLFRVMLTITHYTYLIFNYFFKTKHIFIVMQGVLNRPTLLPWLSKATPRLYVYSKGDRMIPHTEVEAHATRAREAGFETRMELFESSSHVAHARTDPTRYWGAVKALWATALAESRSGSS